MSEVIGFVDSNFTGDLDKRKSTTSYLFMLSNCIINLKASVQAMVALSLIEAEFLVATEITKESMWLKGVLNELWSKYKSIFYVIIKMLYCWLRTKYIMRGPSILM